jgi:hypothetical protein
MKKKDRDFSSLCLNIQGLARMLYSELNGKRGVSSDKARDLAKQILTEAAHLHALVDGE